MCAIFVGLSILGSHFIAMAQYRAQWLARWFPLASNFVVDERKSFSAKLEKGHMQGIRSEGRGGGGGKSTNAVLVQWNIDRNGSSSEGNSSKDSFGSARREKLHKCQNGGEKTFHLTLPE